MRWINLGIATVVPIALSACFDDLRMYSTYENMDAVRADNAIGRGWIPDWIPDNAIGIHEHHDLDTSIRAISFSVDQLDPWPWPTKCTPVVAATRPSIETQLFPKAPHRLADIQDCGELFAVRDPEGVIHMWTRPGGS